MGEVDGAVWFASNEIERRLEQFVRGLTYTDGWEFLLSRDTRIFSGVPFIHVTWTVDDVDTPGTPSLLTGYVQFRREYGDHAFNALLYDLWKLISDLEGHERMELLCVDGATIWEPHPDGSRDDPLRCAPDFAALPACLSERMPA